MSASPSGLASRFVSHKVGAFVIVVATLYGLGSIFPDYWLRIIGFLLSWVACDTAISWFIESVGDNSIRIRLINTRFQAPGRVYIAFFVGIIVSTILSNSFVELILSGASTPNGQALIVSSLVIAGLVYLDLRGRYYKP